jgi:hypothetical protein
MVITLLKVGWFRFYRQADGMGAVRRGAHWHIFILGGNGGEVVAAIVTV